MINFQSLSWGIFLFLYSSRVYFINFNNTQIIIGFIIYCIFSLFGYLLIKSIHELFEHSNNNSGWINLDNIKNICSPPVYCGTFLLTIYSAEFLAQHYLI